MLVLGMQIHFTWTREPSLRQHGESSAGCSPSEILVHP